MEELYINVPKIGDKSLDEEVRYFPKSLLNEGKLNKWHKRGSGKSWLECLMRTRHSKVTLGAKKKTHFPVFGPKAPGK